MAWLCTSAYNNLLSFLLIEITHLHSILDESLDPIVLLSVQCECKIITVHVKWEVYCLINTNVWSGNANYILSLSLSIITNFHLQLDLQMCQWRLFEDVHFIVSLPTIRKHLKSYKLVNSNEANKAIIVQFQGHFSLTLPSHKMLDCNCRWDCRGHPEEVACLMTSLPRCIKNWIVISFRFSVVLIG